MVESGKRLLSTQFVQVPDTPTNFHRFSTSRSTELAKALEILPNSPKESGSVPIISITYLELIRILSVKFHLDVSTPCVFQDFRSPRFPFPPSSPLHPQIRFELKIEHLRHKLFLYIRFHRDPITHS